MTQIRFNADVNPADGAWVADVSVTGPIPNGARFNTRSTTNGTITPITDTNSGPGFNGVIAQGAPFVPIPDPSTAVVQAAIDTANAQIATLNAAITAVVATNAATTSVAATIAPIATVSANTVTALATATTSLTDKITALATVSTAVDKVLTAPEVIASTQTILAAVPEPAPVSPTPLPAPVEQPAPEPLPSPEPYPQPTPLPEPQPEPQPAPEPAPVEQPAPEPVPAPAEEPAAPAEEPPVATPDPEGSIGEPPIESVPEEPLPPIEEPVPPQEPTPVEPPVEEVPVEEPPIVEPPSPPPVDPMPENPSIEPSQPPVVITEDTTAETWVPAVAPEKYLAPEEIVVYKELGLVPNSTAQLPTDVPKPAPAEVLVAHVQVDVPGVENGGIQFFGTQTSPQVVNEDGTLTPPAPAPGSGDPIPPDAITTEETFIGQPGGTTFNAPDVAVPVELVPVEVPAALDVIPGAGATIQAVNQAYVALANIGNDMSPVTRKKAKKILVITVAIGAVRRRFK